MGGLENSLERDYFGRPFPHSLKKVEMVDEKDAPEGYKAVKAQYLCGKCKFLKKNCGDMPELNCTPDLRKDRQLVIFVRADT